jgi:hypothetical protein
MSKGTIVALGIGIIIGAAGMWFVDESKEPKYQVDEIVESYNMPKSTTPSQNAPANQMGGQPSSQGQNQGMDMNNMNMDNTTTGTEQTQGQ